MGVIKTYTFFVLQADAYIREDEARCIVRIGKKLGVSNDLQGIVLQFGKRMPHLRRRESTPSIILLNYEFFLQQCHS